MLLLDIIALITGILFGVYSDNIFGTNEWSQFLKFKDKFNKTYVNDNELEVRFKIFRNNLRDILNHNLDFNQNFTMGVNQFTDLTTDEFKLLYVSGLKTKSITNDENNILGSYGCQLYTSNIDTNINLPLSIDWREKGAVTKVKDQGQCGSCWAFSSTGAIEGAQAISSGNLIDLSEQQLVDCAVGFTYGSYGCNGGQMEGGFKYVIKNGQCSLTQYPYTATDGKCQEAQCNPVAYIKSCYYVKPNDQMALKSAVSKQPVAVAIEADTRYFQSYSGGILTASTCGTTLDHGVLIVGYGEDSGQKYWIVKNSWSDTWGENGYVRIARTDSTNELIEAHMKYNRKT